jgi:hypothetical protein
VLVERVAPCRACFGIAERIEFEDHTFDAELGKQLRA